MVRLLFVTLEFSVGTFSGNGVYAQSQVRALRAQGHEVLVLAGRPADVPPGAAAAAAPAGQLEVALPRWGRLDEGSGWREFAAGAEAHAAAVEAFAPEAVLGVDWHSHGAWRALEQRLPGAADAVPFIYLNYRVYCRTAAGKAREMLRAAESAAVEEAAAVVCLSRSDAQYMREHLNAGSGASAKPQVLLPALRAELEALPPPLDIAEPPQSAAMAAATEGSGSPAAAAQQQRKFLTCCVRLSPEKEPERFAAAIEALVGKPPPAVSRAIHQHSRAAAAADAAASQDTADASVKALAGSGAPAEVGAENPQAAATAPQGNVSTAAPQSGSRTAGPNPDRCPAANRLTRLGVTPLLCGAATSEYGKALQARLRAAAPDAVIEERFLSPAQLAEVYAATKLNVHPCAYDAYGMTIVEAAAAGAPSLIAGGGAVGAGDLLSAAAGECCEFDVRAPATSLADEIERLLLDGNTLAAVGRRAAAKARSWTEAANAAALMRIVARVVGNSKREVGATPLHQ